MKKILRIFNSMRLRLFLVVLLCGVASFLILFHVMSVAYLKKGESMYMDRVRLRAASFADKIADTAYLKNSAAYPDIDRELSSYAQSLNGRIVVTDKNLKIVYDSISVETNKILISKEVVRALSGRDNTYLNAEKMTGEYTVPIYQTNSEDNQSEVAGVMIITVSLEDMFALSGEVNKVVLVAVILLVVALILFGYFFSRHMTRPLKRVTEAINQAGQGYMDVPEKIAGFNEIEDFSDAFSALVTRLNEIENSRQEFVSNVSHELKTPMTSMKVLADSLLATENVPAEMYREFLSDINSEIDRENKIITDLLTLTKFDKSEGSMHIAEVDINELLSITMRRIGPIARLAKVDLSLESHRTVVAEVDEVKLSLAFSNLIENGVKYNKPGGYVHVTLNADHNAFYVKVEDSGIGIPEEALSKIFDRFYRVDKTRSRETGGTGLGLAITKNVVIMHKGDIKAESVLGEGTVFSVRIPLTYINK